MQKYRLYKNSVNNPANNINIPYNKSHMWLISLAKQAFRSRSSLSDIVLDSLSVAIQSIISIYFGIFFLSKTGFDATQLLLYYVFTLAIINPIQRKAPLRQMEQMVLHGTVSSHLLRPYQFMAFFLSKSILQSIFVNIAVFITVCSMIFFLIGFPSLELVHLVRLLIIFPVTLVFMGITLALILYLAFYFEKITAYYRIYFMMGYFFSGGFIPINALVHWGQYLPQFYLYGAPAHFLATGQFINPLLGISYLLAFSIILFFVHKTCIRRLEVNGG
jgi:ABC-type uncharacterized transport system permease subunit